MYLTNEWSAGMASHVFNNTYEDIIDDGYYEYKVNTPFKWGAGIAYTFGAAALISVDYEGADYSSITMAGRNERFAFVEDNNYLSKNARTVSNVRVGAEYRIQEIAIRAGYAYYQNPLTAMNDTHIGSVGLGYRGRYFFMDAAYSFAPSDKLEFVSRGKRVFCYGNCAGTKRKPE